MPSSQHLSKAADADANTSNAYASSIGERVFKARRKAGMTQKALAEAIGVNKTTISRIEGGSRNLSGDILLKIATVLDMDAADASIEAGITTSAPLLVTPEPLEDKERRRLVVIERRLMKLAPEKRRQAYVAIEGILDALG